MGKYIYGIINSNTALRLFVPREYTSGILSAGSGQAPGELEKERKTDGVYTIPYQDISAVVCDSHVVEYTNMPRDAVARLLVRHQKVIEKVMSLGHTVIPVRLGIFAQDEDEVKDILYRGYNLIKDIAEKVSDKIEIDVVATWSDFSSVLKEVGQEREIKEFKEILLANPKGITVDGQMKIGVMVKKVLDKKREKYAGDIIACLSKAGSDFKVHELMDDKMVINAAFLIKAQAQRDFDGRIEELNAGFAELVNFRCVGPLPPYSFYTLQIKRLQFREIDWARKKLGLESPIISKEEIKKAHRVKVSFFHPDKNPDIPGAEREFDDVTMAYNALLEYWEAVGQTDEGNRRSFNEEEFKKNPILVKIQR